MIPAEGMGADPRVSLVRARVGFPGGVRPPGETEKLHHSPGGDQADRAEQARHAAACTVTQAGSRVDPAGAPRPGGVAGCEGAAPGIKCSCAGQSVLLISCSQRGPVAQWLECRTVTSEAAGSSPVGPASGRGRQEYLAAPSDSHDPRRLPGTAVPGLLTLRRGWPLPAGHLPPGSPPAVRGWKAASP